MLKLDSLVPLNRARIDIQPSHQSENSLPFVPPVAKYQSHVRLPKDRVRHKIIKLLLLKEDELPIELDEVATAAHIAHPMASQTIRMTPLAP